MPIDFDPTVEEMGPLDALRAIERSVEFMREQQAQMLDKNDMSMALLNFIREEAALLREYQELSSFIAHTHLGPDMPDIGADAVKPKTLKPCRTLRERYDYLRDQYTKICRENAVEIDLSELVTLTEGFEPRGFGDVVGDKVKRALVNDIIKRPGEMRGRAGEQPFSIRQFGERVPYPIPTVEKSEASHEGQIMVGGSYVKLT